MHVLDKGLEIVALGIDALGRSGSATSLIDQKEGADSIRNASTYGMSKDHRIGSGAPMEEDHEPAMVPGLVPDLPVMDTRSGDIEESLRFPVL